MRIIAIRDTIVCINFGLFSPNRERRNRIITPMLIISTHPGTIFIFVIIVLLVVFWNKLNSTDIGALLASVLKSILIILFVVGYIVLAIRCS